jgi:hypothetical protein
MILAISNDMHSEPLFEIAMCLQGRRQFEERRAMCRYSRHDTTLPDAEMLVQPQVANMERGLYAFWSIEKDVCKTCIYTHSDVSLAYSKTDAYSSGVALRIATTWASCSSSPDHN